MNTTKLKTQLLAACCAMAGSLFLASGACAEDAATETWKPYVSEDGTIKADFPAKPTVTDQTTKSAVGDLKFRVVGHAGAKGAMQITRIDYPVAPEGYDVPTGLRGAVDGAVTNTKGKLLSVKDIKMFGLPGKECMIEAGGGRFVAHVRVFIDGNGPTLYLAQALGSKDFVTSPDAAKFLDSFQITPVEKKEK